MTSAHPFEKYPERLRALIAFFVNEGWHVRRTSGGRTILSKSGSASIYAGAALNDKSTRFIPRSYRHD